MKRIKNTLVVFSILIACYVSHAQVGINTVTPDPDAILDISSTTKGLLIPRVSLTATNLSTPLSANVAGMTVYNTATAGTTPNNVTPGYYYNDGSKWIKIAGENISKRELGKSLGTAVGNYIEFAKYEYPNGAHNLKISVSASISSYSVSKSYDIAVKYSQTNGVWQTLNPITSTGNYSGNDFEVDIKVSSNTLTLRLRKSTGSIGGLHAIIIENMGYVDDVFTELSATGNTTAPTTIFSSTPLTQVEGKVGIGTSSPSENLQVKGSLSTFTQMAAGSYGGFYSGANALGIGVPATALFAVPKATFDPYNDALAFVQVAKATAGIGASDNILGTSGSQSIINILPQSTTLISDNKNTNVHSKLLLNTLTEGNVDLVSENNTANNRTSVNWTSNTPVQFLFNNGGVVSSYKFPRIDGASGEVLTTDGSGNISWEASNNTLELQKSLGTGVNDYIEFAQYVYGNGAHNLRVSVSASISSYSVSKTYDIAAKYSQTGGAWQLLNPVTSTGDYGGNDFAVDIKVSNNTLTLRLRKSSGSVGGVHSIRIENKGYGDDVFTELSATGSTTAPVAIFSSTPITQYNGNVSIGSSTANVRLTVGGTDALQVPNGTSVQRPSPVFGMLRYNSTIGRGEMYVNDANGDGTTGDAGWRPF